jgi:hypothetical protein
MAIHDRMADFKAAEDATIIGTADCETMGWNPPVVVINRPLLFEYAECVLFSTTADVNNVGIRSFEYDLSVQTLTTAK